MARGRIKRRRRKGRFSFLLRFFGFLIAAGAVIAALTLFFKMDHIIVSGSERYTEQEVLDVSGLRLGDNLYLMNKYAVKEKIFAQLPYVEEVSINRKLPDTLLIEVRECGAAAGVEDGGGVWLISDRGKLLEPAGAPPAGCPRVTGGTLIEPVATAPMDFGEDASYRALALLTLLRASAERGVRGYIGAIDISDDTALTFTYLGRFTVKLPWTADIGYKLESLNAVVDYLEGNETGTIDLMTEGKASFIPN